MPYKKGQPSFVTTLASVAAVTRGMFGQQRFGEPYIRLYNFCELVSYLYEWGALIGRAKRDKLSTLEKMVLPGRPWSMESLQDQAKTRLEAYRNDNGQEPNSFIKFIQMKELEDAIGLPNLYAITHGDEKARKALDKKIPLAEAALPIEEFGLEGIGFGSCFPSLTEIMYRTDYENITAQRSEPEVHNSANPERHTEPSLEEQEKDLLDRLAAYALKYYPELLDPLDLRGHLDAT